LHEVLIEGCVLFGPIVYREGCITDSPDPWTVCTTSPQPAAVSQNNAILSSSIAELVLACLRHPTLNFRFVNKFLLRV